VVIDTRIRLKQGDLQTRWRVTNTSKTSCQTLFSASTEVTQSNQPIFAGRQIGAIASNTMVCAERWVRTIHSTHPSFEGKPVELLLSNKPLALSLPKRLALFGFYLLCVSVLIHYLFL